MSFCRTRASILVMLSAVVIGGSTLTAQSPGLPAQSAAHGTGLFVPVTGVADLGGLFSGALFIERFTAQGNAIVARGMVTGALTVNGTIRNLVIPLTLPLDISASRARSDIDPALAQSSCDALHIELGGTTINVLGLNVGLNPVAFDLVQPPVAAVSTPSRTVTTSPSANTTQPPPGSTATPGVVAPTANAATANAPVSGQTLFSSLLCSVDRFRDVSNPALLVQQLNAILSALATPQGPS